MSEAPKHRLGDRFLFGPFEFRPVERELLCQDAAVDLGGRAMDVLLCLLEHQGDVVSHGELLSSGWRGLNVEPTALRVQISVLRKALAEVDPASRYITNVAGRGYCFAAPVRREAASAPTATTPDTRRRASLPPAPQGMIGRESVIDDLERRIATERFVTLVGPGGIGKTTVARALGQRLSGAFEGDVGFVDLAIHKGEDSVAAAVATALRLSRLEGDPAASVASQLRSRRLLLILDSCEHVISGAAALAEAVWQSAPRCHIVATSREPLKALGEQVHRLGALGTPPPLEAPSFEQVCDYPAAQLFVERVAAGGGQIEHGPADALLVADICRKLDGIPLAIELAAGRVHAFGLATTHALLDSRLRLSWPGRRTALPRHVTLSAALDWSYDLLSDEEAGLLRALSVFVGWFTLDGGQAVSHDPSGFGAAEALAGLVTKSLVSADRQRALVRYRLLDTTRQYARLKLEAAGELAKVAARHARWTLGDLGHQEAQLGLPARPEWADYFGNRVQDAQAAIDWSLATNGDPQFAVPLTIACLPIWELLGRYEELQRRSEVALKFVEPGSREELLLNLDIAFSALSANDVGRAEVAATRALDLATTLDDSFRQFRARYWLWNTYIGARPNISKAQQHALRCRELTRLKCGPAEQAQAEDMVGVSDLVAGDFAAARAAIDRARTLSPAVTNSANTRVSLLWVTGLPDTARAAAQDRLDEANMSGFPGPRAAALADSCGGLAMYVGDLAAADRYADLIDDCVARGAWLTYATWARALRAAIAARRGDVGPGLSLLTNGLPPECGHPRFASVLTELALRLGDAGAKDVARDFADRLLQRIETTGERWIWSEVQRVRGELARDAATAQALFEAALAEAQARGAHAWALRAATSLARRRPSAAQAVLTPLLASFTEGGGTQDHVEARAVLSEYGLDPP